MNALRLCTCLALAVLLIGAAPSNQEPLVRVNGQVITQADLERYAAVRNSQPDPAEALPGPEELGDAGRRQILQSLIDHRLILEKARDAFLDPEHGQQVLDAYAESRLEELEQRLGSELKVRQFLARKGLSIEDYRRTQTENLLVIKYMMDNVLGDIAVRPDEVRRYYREHKDQFRQPRKIVYRQILILVANPSEREAKRRKARALLERIRKGADFARLADEHSADADRYPGGLHEVVVPESHSDWMPACVRGLEPGQTCELRETAGGFAVVRLEKVQEPRLRSFLEVQSEIEQFLLAQKRAERQEEFVQKLRRRARIEYLDEELRLSSR